LLLAGVAFAVANQLGNAGHTISAVILILAGIAYAAIIVRASSAA
jgi:thioesterase domain-containing protein